MAKTKEQNAKHQRDFRERERMKDQARAKQLDHMLSTAPDGIGQHVRLSLGVEDGEARIVWNLDDAGAAFINEYADSIEVPAHLLLKELSIEAGRRLIRGAYEMGGSHD